MSSNVGLSTPRGSGTSGYVQRNQAHLRPRDKVQPYPKEPDLLRHKQRQPDKQILAHERAREIEVKVFDLRDQLEEEGVEEDKIEAQCDALRKKLTAKAAGGVGASGKGLKKHQVHEMAAAKIQESERLRRALGIRKDYEEGSHWKRQEERLQEIERRKQEEVEHAEAKLEREREAEREEELDREEERYRRRRHRSDEPNDTRSPDNKRGRPRERSTSRSRSSSYSTSRSGSYSSRSYDSRSRSRSRSRD